MAMHALDKKLLRDFRRLWAQALAIALVLACGIAVLLTTFGMYQALDETRRAYYDTNRFADIFVSVRRAPLSLMAEVREIDGVLVAEARTTGNAILDLPGRTETAVGRIVSLPPSGDATLNLPVLRSGRLPDPDATDEVAVNEPFALANGFQPGDTFQANLNGRKRVLTITGTLLSPEFIYTIGPGAMMPDNETFGILWMPERAVSAAFDTGGAFNNLSLRIAAGTEKAAVIDALDTLFDPYGGLGAYDRAAQESHAFIDAEITQLRSTGLILPPIFFGISAFLVNMVMGRIVTLERSEIGLLKAIGYSNAEVCLHYLYLSALIAAVGVVIGWIVGDWLSRSLAALYAEFFNFPYLIYQVPYPVYAVSGLLGIATAVAGALQAALRAARLAPATAMAPPAPPRYKRTALDRLMRAARLSQPAMMVLRALQRWPLRAGLSTLGLSLAVAILVAASFFDDSLEEIIQSAFYQSNRQDVMLVLSGEANTKALAEAQRLPGVMVTEGMQMHAAILRHGRYEKRTGIEARPKGNDLSRIVDRQGRIVEPPEDGILLSESLATQLRAGPGDRIEAEFLTGRRETLELTISGTIPQYIGLGAYVSDSFLNRAFRQGERLTTINLLIDEARLDDFHEAVQDIPGIAGTIMLADNRRAFEDTIAENVVIMMTIYVVIATLITVGISYNSARIQLSERAREFASLRVLGFTRAEVSFILVGEVMLLTLMAQPLGWGLGYLIVLATTEGFDSDLYRIPLVLKPQTFAVASLIVLASALGAVAVVRRRIDRLDLVAVMKTRE